MVRETIVQTQAKVDSVYNGKFVRDGILELEVDDIRAEGLVFEYEDDPEWGTDAHFLLRRVGTPPKLQRLNNTQKFKLASLAKTKPLSRSPK